MGTLQVECLRCGESRRIERSPWRILSADDCPRCGYLGWAPSIELTERSRRALRDRPIELRRLRVVA
jgi:hypothetical protein